MHQHVFVGDNFFMQQMLNRYRDDLDVAALPQELSTAAEGTMAFLQSQAARVEIQHLEVDSGRLRAEVLVQNLTGHKLPTAFPSRRAWLHFTVQDREGEIVFESGAVRPDGSIVGNDNDADPSRFEPYYREITSDEQVQIYEPILKDSDGHVTTGLLTAIGYLKDDRILPTGFDNSSADKDIAVVGDVPQTRTSRQEVTWFDIQCRSEWLTDRFTLLSSLGISPSDFAGPTTSSAINRWKPSGSSGTTNPCRPRPQPCSHTPKRGAEHRIRGKLIKLQRWLVPPN